MSNSNREPSQSDYISKSYKVDGNNAKSMEEIVDILNDYPWTRDVVVNSASSVDLKNEVKVNLKTNVPFCYVIERKSAANAGIANICNLINYGTEVAGTVLNLLKKKPDEKTKEEDAESNSKLSTFISKIKEFYAKNIEDRYGKLLNGNNLNEDILKPYKYLYITEKTNKSYVFPLANSSSSFTSIANAWGNGAKIPGPIQKLVDGVYAGVDIVQKGETLIENTTNFLNGSGSDVNYIREMAKSYNYPQDGDKVVVNFTLYNTTQVDAWKKNYKFLFLFVLRNLPYRTGVATFVPPLLYDVFVPSVKHLPVCSVAGVNVVPKGMTRILKMPNFMESGKELSINVPEAWEVTITFQSLIGHSANLMLSGICSALNVSTSTSAANPESTEKTTESKA